MQQLASSTADLSLGAGAGRDLTIRGTAEDDILIGHGGNEAIFAYAGDDLIKGNGGHDTIQGGAGNDTIIGGAGEDKMTGGQGADVFVFRVGDSPNIVANGGDEILDLDWQDVIDLSKIDADPTQEGDQAFHLVRGHSTGQAGEVALIRVTPSDGSDPYTALVAYVSGDWPDLYIKLDGDHLHFDGIVL